MASRQTPQGRLCFSYQSRAQRRVRLHILQSTPYTPYLLRMCAVLLGGPLVVAPRGHDDMPTCCEPPVHQLVLFEDTCRDAVWAATARSCLRSVDVNKLLIRHLRLLKRQFPEHHRPLPLPRPSLPSAPGRRQLTGQQNMQDPRAKATLPPPRRQLQGEVTSLGVRPPGAPYGTLISNGHNSGPTGAHQPTRAAARARRRRRRGADLASGQYEAPVKTRGWWRYGVPFSPYGRVGHRPREAVASLAASGPRYPACAIDNFQLGLASVRSVGAGPALWPPSRLPIG